MAFDPKTNKYPYPEDTGVHYLHVKKDKGIIFDTKYPYIGKENKNFWFRMLLHVIGFPIARIRLGLKVKGKENLKKYKDEINKGIVSVCNHVHMWDFLAINAVIKRPIHILAWDKNINGENGFFIRHVGGIPVPTDSRAMIAFSRQTRDMIKEGGWLHIYPEGTMWEYYGMIRPLKPGAAFFAVKSGRPILPMAYSYREPNWIRKHIFKQIANLTLNIGEPIYPNMASEDPQKELTITAFNAMVKLAGIENNLYQPIYNEETSKRIDYYTDTYGVGYKGSW